MNNIVDIDLMKLRQGMDALYEAVESIATRPVEIPKITNNSLSGDHINGGTITNFKSTGIKDTSTKLNLVIADKAVLVEKLDTDELVGDTKLTGNLNVHGEITAKSLNVEQIKAEIQHEKNKPLVFTGSGIGLQWQGQGPTKQFVYREKPDRFWSSQSIDLNSEQYYAIENTPVLRLEELGSSVTKSSLTKVGTLQNLSTQGNLTVDGFLFYNSDSTRLGFGTEAPNGSLAIASLDKEFVIDVETEFTKIGNWTSSDLAIVTDDTKRISISATGKIDFGSKTRGDAKVSVFGQLGVGVNSVKPGTSLSTSGPIEIEGKTMSSGDSAPKEGNFRKGDIVWNNDPQPTGYIGWVCVRDGTPGTWKPFGSIGS